MPATKTLYLKVLSKDNQSCHGGAFDWTDYLPTAGGPGKPLPLIGNPVICERGYHGCTEEALMQDWAKFGMRVYVWQPSSDATAPDGDEKIVSSSGQLLRPYALPRWWTDAMTFISDEIPAIPWLQPDGNPLPEWRVFPNSAASRDASWDASWDASRNASRNASKNASWNASWDASWTASRYASRDASRDAIWDADLRANCPSWDASRDADLYCQCVYICDGTGLADEHVQHARSRWQVWQKGYGLLGDVDGVLYVYEAVS